MRLLPTWRFWKRLAIGLAMLLAVASIANGFMVWRTEARLQAKFAEIRAAGDPATIADLRPEPIPADRNAAAILEALTPRIAEFSKEYAHFFDRTTLGKHYAANPAGTPPTAEQVAAIAAIVDKYPDLEAGIVAASACKEYASLADFSLRHEAFLNDIIENRATPIRNLARFCNWKMEILIAQGQSQQAAELGLQMLQISRLRDNEPLLINYLVNIAVRAITINRLNQALASKEITPELRAAINAELVRQDSPDGLTHTLRSERGLAGTLSASVGLDSKFDEVNPVWMKLAGWPVKRLYIGALESYDGIFEMAAQPWWEVRRQLGSSDANSSPTGNGVLADLLRPALLAAFEAQGRNQNLLRELRIANALAEYRDVHGREASSLDDLDLPREVTIDTYSGQPLKLKHTDDGWLIYSVMQNGIDDGGDFTDLNDYGLAPLKRR